MAWRRRQRDAYPRRVSRPQVELEDLGWDASWCEALRAAASDVNDPVPMPEPSPIVEEPGRVVCTDRGLCTVATTSGPVRASLGGAVLDAAAGDPTQLPSTGDWCVIRHWPDGPVTVETLARRRTALIRASARKSSFGQVLAVNVDYVGLVVALHPEPNLARLERLLSVAWASGATPVVLLTKVDLVGDAAEVAEDVRAVAPDLDVVICSTTTGAGIADVRALLAPGRTMALIGASGHGKSSLTNAVVGADVLTTRAIRDDGRGRHTSVRRELLLVPSGGAVIDTPGLRGVGLQQDDGALDAAFPKIDALAAECRFRDCRHAQEPGCAVTAAVAAGAVPVRRFQSWQALQRESARAERRTDARRRADITAEWRQRAQQRAFRRKGSG